MKVRPAIQRHVGILLLALVVLLSACKNTQKLIDSGNYDAAVEYAVKKLRGKTKKKAKYVAALEDGFAKATKRDMKRIKHLRKEIVNRPDNWEKIFSIAQDIDFRQNLIEPLLPVIDKEGYHASFQFVQADVILVEAKREAAAHLYNLAERQLMDAERGDKLAAREAYRNLERIDRYIPNYRQQNALMNQARHLGTTHVLFNMRNNAPTFLPAGFEREVTRVGIGDLQGGWLAYHTSLKKDVNIDYRIVMNILDIDVSPERVSERAYVDSKEIEDGIEYLYDDAGKPVVDSTGNHISIPKKIFISAEVLETFQSKYAKVGGQLEFYNYHTNELVHTEPILVETRFENYASTFRGDRRALSPDSKRRIGNRPLPFPSDADLLLQAADRLKPIMKDKIKWNEDIVASL